MARGYAVVQAPSHLGLRAAGVERAPRALLGHGLAERTGARLAARVAAPEGETEPGPQGILNADLLASYSIALADAVGDVLDAGEFPVVLGGDCSIMLGTTLALRRRGRFGLLFLDAHADFYEPEAEPTGEAASMELGLATGRGPDLLSALERRRPLVRDEDVVVVGQRDAELAAAEGSRPLAPGIALHELADVRRRGAGAIARDALDRLTALSGFWVHLDVDVLDDDLMPAVDYRLPGGLSWDELRVLLAAALGAAGAVGMELTIFNPDLDPEGTYAARLADELVRALTDGSASRPSPG